MRQTLWQKLAEFPPVACRLLARERTATGGVRALTSAIIAQRSGMTVMEVNSLSWLTSWDSVPFVKIRPFMEACGIDLTNKEILRTHSSYIRRGAPFKYLKLSPDWEKVYKPLIIAYVSTRATTPSPNPRTA